MKLSRIENIICYYLPSYWIDTSLLLSPFDPCLQLQTPWYLNTSEVKTSTVQFVFRFCVITPLLSEEHNGVGYGGWQYASKELELCRNSTRENKYFTWQISVRSFSLLVDLIDILPDCTSGMKNELKVTVKLNLNLELTLETLNDCTRQIFLRMDDVCALNSLFMIDNIVWKNMFGKNSWQ